jgi:hypothetical protein
MFSNIYSNYNYKFITDRFKFVLLKHRFPKKADILLSKLTKLTLKTLKLLYNTFNNQ